VVEVLDVGSLAIKRDDDENPTDTSKPLLLAGWISTHTCSMPGLF
jgi:hypothetical protein